MFAVILATLIASATAFTPAGRAPVSGLKMSFENELGVINPTGFWDPLGLSKNLDAAVINILCDIFSF